MGRKKKNPGVANLQPRYGMRFCVVCGVGCRHWTDAACFTCRNIGVDRQAPTDDVKGTLSKGFTCDACLEFCMCDRIRVPVKKFPNVSGVVMVCKSLVEQMLGDRSLRKVPNPLTAARTAQKALFQTPEDPGALSTAAKVLGSTFLSPKTTTK